MSSLLSSAKLQLTLWYTLIILVITSTLSVAFYFRVSNVLELEYERIEHRIERDNEMMQFRQRMGIPDPPLFFVPEDIQTAKTKIAQQLIWINALIVIVFVTAGYFLADKTLEPIHHAMEEQKRFIGDAAHELKTPLTALKTSLEVNLMDKSLPKEAQVILKENLVDVISLQSLSESLLKLSKVHDQKLSLSPIKIKPNLDQAVKYVTSLAKKRHITIKIQEKNPNLTIMAEATTLTELFVIFLDNAIKYSHEKDTIGITISSHSKNADIAITDTGIGIAADQLPHIYDRFYRADKARTKKEHDGFGLGLSVAQKIIHELNGKISVESTEGKGTTFRLQFPLVNK